MQEGIHQIGRADWQAMWDCQIGAGLCTRMRWWRAANAAHYSKAFVGLWGAVGTPEGRCTDAVGTFVGTHVFSGGLTARVIENIQILLIA